jgi:hypothetical protein
VVFSTAQALTGRRSENRAERPAAWSIPRGRIPGPPAAPSVTSREDPVHCREVIQQISEYLDAETARELAAELESHLVDCPNCRIYVDTVKKTITLYRSEKPLECPAEVRRRLHLVLSYEYRK